MSFFCATIPTWVSETFPIFERICLVILALLALALIVLVFMQITGGSETSNAITGNKDSYYSLNKSGSREGRITRLVYIIVSLIAVFTIIYFVLLKIPTLY